MLAGPLSVKPYVQTGVGVCVAFGSSHPETAALRSLSTLYEREQYWLVWRGGGGYALLLEGFQAGDMLRLLWQVGVSSTDTCQVT